MLSYEKSPAVAMLVILLGVALYTDLRYGKIYNKLTFPCMAAGLVLGFLHNGLQGLIQSVAGIGLVLALYLLAYSKAIGGGDIKLMMAVGSLIGIKLTIWAMLFSGVIGGVLALAVLAWYRRVVSATKNLAAYSYMKIVLRSSVDLPGSSTAPMFRYSPAIALGTLLALLVK